MTRKLFIKFALPFIVFINVIIIGVLVSIPRATFELIFLDVGQGDSTLIQVGGSTQILIDGGPDDTVLDRLGEEMPLYDRRIEYVFISHPHADHISGVISLLGKYDVGTLYMNPIQYESPIYEKLQQELWRFNIIPQSFRVGDALVFGDVTIRALWPLPGALLPNEDAHADALVLAVTYKEIDALLTSDFELGGERVLNPGLISALHDIEILKVPHQGSAGGITQQLLATLNPELSVIPVGKNNRYGHPSDETLSLLSSHKSRILRTDMHGTIKVISSNGNDYKTILNSNKMDQIISK